MGIKQRREREKQEVRQGILTAAREIALQEGWQALTIRKVAERIEYSPPTIYEYFASKEDILLELLREGSRQLAATLQAAGNAVKEPEARLLKMADAYWGFAMHHPELYQVMHGLNGVPLDCSERPPNSREAFAVTLHALQDWMEATGSIVTDPEGAVEIIRSTLHGIIALSMSERIYGGRERAQQLVRRAMQDLLVAWSCKKRG